MQTQPLLRCAIFAAATVAGFGSAARSEEGSTKSLRVYVASDDRAAAQAMLGNYVESRIAKVDQKRESQLAALRSPHDWRRRQQQVRSFCGGDGQVGAPGELGSDEAVPGVAAFGC